MTNPLVTVVMPTFNRQELLPASVGSVRNQTFADWELLVVDDRSTDESQALVQGWEAEDPRIRYLPSERTKGPAGARNTGIEHARGQYVAFLDSDDEWLPFHLERMTYYLQKYPEQIDIMSANAERRLRTTGEVYQLTSTQVDEPNAARLEDAWVFDASSVFDRVFDHGIMVTQSLVMKRELLDCVRFREELPPGPEDHYFQLELAAKHPKIGYLTAPHVIYWAHGDNLTTCGGVAAHPRKLERLYKTFQAEYDLMLRELPLSPQQRRAVTELKAREGFWHIGYGGHLQLGEFSEARRWFLKSIQLRPWRIAYWKTFFASYVHQAISRRPSADAAATLTK